MREIRERQFEKSLMQAALPCSSKHAGLVRNNPNRSVTLRNSRLNSQFIMEENPEAEEGGRTPAF